MEIVIKPMTRELCHEFYKEFVLDLALFVNPEQYRPQIYNKEACDAYYDRHKRLGRYHMAITLQEKPIGEIILKNIDQIKNSCTMGITMVNDNYKGKGYGTAAEKKVLHLAFQILGFETVYADSLLGNLRSQRVLKKVGFEEIGRDDTFIYYQCTKSDWKKRPYLKTVPVRLV